MNTSILNYPGFQALPKGVKQMLLVSESHFFDQPPTHRHEEKTAPREKGNFRGLRNFLTRPLILRGAPMDAPA